MDSFNQFSLLLWKNYILQKRRPIATIFELIIPMFFAALLIIIRSTITVEVIHNVTHWNEFSVDHLPYFDESLLPKDHTLVVGYSPSGAPNVGEVMQAVEKRLNTNIPKLNLEDTCGLNFKDIENGRIPPSVEDCIRRELQLEKADRKDLDSFNVSDRSKVLKFFPVIPKIKVKPFPTEADFLEYVKNDTNLASTLAGVIFHGLNASKRATSARSFRQLPSFPDDLEICLRFHGDPITVKEQDKTLFSGIRNSWHTRMLFPLLQQPGPRQGKADTGGAPYYYNEGFLSLLHAINMALGTVMTGPSNQTWSFGLERYPFPPYIDDTFILAIQNTLPLVILLSFFYTALVIVRSVVQEKELKLKEYMIMMGLSNWLHWLAWFVKYFIFLSISCLVMSGLFKINVGEGSVLTHSDMSVVFVFFLLFSIATICFSFLMSVCFSKANVGAAAGGIIYLLTYMPYLFMSKNFESISDSLLLFSSVLSNIAMANGFYLVGAFEGKGTGVQWSTINQGVTVDTNFTLLQVFGMLILDAVLYMLLAVYIEGVWPGDYGMPKPWYFPFTKDYWLGAKAKPSHYQLLSNEDAEAAGDRDRCDPTHDGEFFEAEPDYLTRTVEIKGLKKVYKVNGQEKVAVNNLFLNMYDGQITVLLGHNGAGKTTTMSMLTGFFPPTSGDAIVDGHSINKDIKGVRRAMGLCPQFNILFDLLTVDEHIYFFARLKGLTRKEAMMEVTRSKESLKLTDKGSAQSRTLSGGMKRKLSVGIALCAGSKYVILDEPTSGMDPSARRAIWDVLQLYKNKCSILLSTHFMDEADLLGDRIAIMAEGKLRCSGSPVFLKSKFGVGYHIVMTKSAACDVHKLTALIRSHVPETKLERSSGAELSFVLPFNASPRFSKLFEELDSNAASLGISGYGAIVTTMEEVFLRVTENTEEALTAVEKKMTDTQIASVNTRSSFRSSDASAHALDEPRTSVNSRRDSILSRSKLNYGFTLWRQQFYALLVKKILHSMRNYKVSIAQLLVPVCFAILAMLSVNFTPFEPKNIPLNLSLDKYGPNYVYVNNPENSQFGEVYKRQFEGTLEIAEVYNKKSDLGLFLANRHEQDGGTFDPENIVSASFNETGSHALGWFNDEAFHSPASSLAYLDRAYLSTITNRQLRFSYVNYPLPRNTTGRIEEQLIGSLSGFFLGFYIVLGFSFLAASFCLFLVRERVDRSALLQTLAGVEPFCFWISAFVWDFVNFIIPCLLTVVLFYIFSLSEFTDHIGIAILMFVLFCWSSLPLMYLFSFFFTVPSTALVRVTLFNVVAGSASILTINILRLLNMPDLADDLNWVFLFIPPYCLGMGLADVYANAKFVKICTINPIYEFACKHKGINYQTNFLALEQYGVGKFVVFLAAQGFIYFFILFFFEFRIHRLLLRLPWPKAFNKVVGGVVDEPEERVDDDVAEEAAKIERLTMSELEFRNQLIIKNLRKIYGKGSKALVAVKNLCVAVPRGECFGLLGINGAGKTTTFKMLTGDLTPTSGSAYLDGYDIRTHLRQAQQRMGYCPQFDALIEQMTGAETLRMFARLRGVPEDRINYSIASLGEMLQFSVHLDKQCGQYSGGNKRKLSTAIAMIGDPPVVLLDEPSTGMDPGARRMLWDALTTVRSSGKSILITSHSMEECEALCTRLVIMVNGAFKCLGGSQHLKNKFGQGYTAEIKAMDGEVEGTMMEYFPDCELKDTHGGVLTYSIPQTTRDETDLSLAMVFERMELAKEKGGFGDYTVTQTTLEQVFLRLVRWQRESETDHRASFS